MNLRRYSEDGLYESNRINLGATEQGIRFTQFYLSYFFFYSILSFIFFTGNRTEREKGELSKKSSDLVLLG